MAGVGPWRTRTRPLEKWAERIEADVQTGQVGQAGFLRRQLPGAPRLTGANFLGLCGRLGLELREKKRRSTQHCKTFHFPLTAQGRQTGLARLQTVGPRAEFGSNKRSDQKIAPESRAQFRGPEEKLQTPELLRLLSSNFQRQATRSTSNGAKQSQIVIKPVCFLKTCDLVPSVWQQRPVESSWETVVPGCFGTSPAN